jgi:DNA adenine methylase
MSNSISPLRYPGSKGFLAEYIESFVRMNFLQGAHLYEPFAGGASVSLSLLSSGAVRRVTLVERDPLIASLWRCIVKEPESLCRRIADTRITLTTWRRVRRLLDESNHAAATELDLGFAGLFLNRTSFSGILSAGPIGGVKQRSAYKIDCRFNRTDLINRVTRIHAFSNRIAVQEGDGIAYIKSNRSRIKKNFGFLFVDPPYIGQGKRLYRYFYSRDQHRELADLMQTLDSPWLATYDLVSPVRRIYNGSTTRRVFVGYSAKASKREPELLISNRTLPRISYK